MAAARISAKRPARSVVQSIAPEREDAQPGSSQGAPSVPRGARRGSRSARRDAGEGASAPWRCRSRRSRGTPAPRRPPGQQGPPRCLEGSARCGGDLPRRSPTAPRHRARCRGQQPPGRAVMDERRGSAAESVIRGTSPTWAGRPSTAVTGRVAISSGQPSRLRAPRGVSRANSVTLPGSRRRGLWHSGAAGRRASGPAAMTATPLAVLHARGRA
jgi:hypothetical protein